MYKARMILAMMFFFAMTTGCMPALTPALHRAARDNNLGKIDALLHGGHEVDEPDICNLIGFRYTPLHYAAANGAIRAIELLLARGANIDSSARGRITPLQAACGLFFTPIRPGEGSSEAAIYLIKRGADPSLADIDGFAPIHDAAAYGRIDVIKALLSKNVDINAGNRTIGTPLHYAFPAAIPRRKYALPTAEFLLKEGADINATTASGETPLHRVARMGNCEWVKFLITHGADVNQPARNGETPLSFIKEYCPGEIP